MAQIAERSEMILALEPRPESARIVRRALRAQGLSADLAHTVDLLATEIIGNAVRHADLRDGQRIVFFARVSGDYVRVEIADPGPGFDPDGVQTSGYGLRLLEALATRWGIECTRGCRVWFEVDRRARPGTGRFGRVLAA
jgi:serine/threonine-protein kinase RsbW